MKPTVVLVNTARGELIDEEALASALAEGRIAAAGLERGACFIANCVKCRPPQNREPHPDELGACLPYLERQVAILAPLSGPVPTFGVSTRDGALLATAETLWAFINFATGRPARIPPDIAGAFAVVDAPPP